MKRLFHLLLLGSVLLAGCPNPDPTWYETQLPNGYLHRSNGGSFGYIQNPVTKSKIPSLGMQDNGEEWWCNEFAWQGQWVICQIVEESGKSPPRPPEYLIVDTSKDKATQYKDRVQVENAWKSVTGTAIPQLNSIHPGRRRL